MTQMHETFGERFQKKLVAVGFGIVILGLFALPVIPLFKEILRNSFVSDVKAQSEAMDILFPAYVDCRHSNSMADCLVNAQDTAYRLGYSEDFEEVRDWAKEYELAYMPK